MLRRFSKSSRPLAHKLCWASYRAVPSWNFSQKIVVTELCGDGIGPEIQKSVHTVADKLPIKFQFDQIDWSLDRRESQQMHHEYIDEAFESMNQTKLAIKYPTVTKTRSPNGLFRRRANFSVIYRPAISIEGINSNFKKDVNMHIVRIATGGTYDDPGQKLGYDTAVSIRLVERKPCMEAAHFAFKLAQKKKLTVTSASKHTIQKVTDGFFEHCTRKVAKDYKHVTHEVELFDALLGKVIISPDKYQVVLCLNEYGDFLSDLASGLVGSLGTGASGNYSFKDDYSVDCAMFDPAGGTAPDIAGQNKANPAAILLAYGMLLDHIGRYDLGHALRMALLESVSTGHTTADLGGKLSCSEFTTVVADKMDEMLEKVGQC